MDVKNALESYASDRSFVKGFAPVDVRTPKNYSEVEEIVKWANQTKTPLVPVSSAGPHHRGGTVPQAEGAVIVDLTGMNKIIRIDKVQRIVIVEPGVTYEQLLPELAKEGLTIAMPLSPRPGKSVMTDALETAPRLNSMHQWNFLDPVRCLEVVYGDGRRIFTGDAGLGPKDLEKQWENGQFQWEPTGPFMLDFFRLLTGAQGTMGIVTWAALRCEFLPKAQSAYFVSADKAEDLLGFVRALLRIRHSDGLFIANRAQLCELYGKDADFAEWTVVVNFTGRHDIMPQGRVDYQTKDAEEIAAGFGLKLEKTVGGVNADELFEKASTPGTTDFRENKAGTYQEIMFETTLDKVPEFTQIVLSLAETAGFFADDIGVYAQPENLAVSYRLTFLLPYDANDADETARMKKLFEDASRAVSEKDAYFIRPYGMWADLQMAKDEESLKILRQLKEVFDPNHILNPGKLCL